MNDVPTLADLRAAAPRGPWTKYDRFLPCHLVVKRHKRLWITTLEWGELLYTPPDFVQLTSRSELQELADTLDLGVHYADAVMAFEAHVRRPRRHQTTPPSGR